MLLLSPRGSSDVKILLVRIPGRCSSNFNDCLKVQYYLFLPFKLAERSWVSEKASDTKRKKLSKGSKQQSWLMYFLIWDYRKFPITQAVNLSEEVTAKGGVYDTLTWWEEWKWKGSVSSNYSASHWQEVGNLSLVWGSVTAHITAAITMFDVWSVESYFIVY